MQAPAPVPSQLGSLRQAWQRAAQTPASRCLAPADDQGRLSVPRLRAHGRGVGHISRADLAKGRAPPGADEVGCGEGGQRNPPAQASLLGLADCHLGGLQGGGNRA